MPSNLQPNRTLLNQNFDSYKYTPTQIGIKGAPLEDKVHLVENSSRYAKVNKLNLLYCGKYIISENFELIKVLVDKVNN
jgi:hypothetical protein